MRTSIHPIVFARLSDASRDFTNVFGTPSEVPSWNVPMSCLSSNQGLLLTLVLYSRLGRSDRLVVLEILLGSRREVSVADAANGLGLGGGRGRSGGLGAGLATLQQLLGLGGVVSHVLLGHLSGLGGVRACNLSELLGLGTDNVLRVLNVVVNQLLVGGVDQRHGEEEGGGEKRKSPVRDDLDKPVGEESADGDLWKICQLRSTKLGCEGICIAEALTVAEAPIFSAKRIRWDSMTRKLRSSWKSPKIASKVSRGTV